MLYQILGLFIDLSAVKSVHDAMNGDLYGKYAIRVGFHDVEEPYEITASRYEPGELQAGRQAFAHILRDVVSLEPDKAGAPYPSVPFQFIGQEIDLANVRAVESVQRDPRTQYSSRNNRAPIINPLFSYRVVIAGSPAIVRRLEHTPDVKMTPLHNEQQKLLRAWLINMEGLEAISVI